MKDISHLNHNPANQNLEGNEGQVPEIKYVSYMGVELPMASNRENAPKIENYSDYIEDAFSRDMERVIATGWALNEPVLIEGGTSLGKTVAVKKMCAQLGYEVHYQNLNNHTDPADLMGKYIPNAEAKNEGDPKYKFSDGPVTKSIRSSEGKIKVLLLDEYNSANPGAIIRLHEVLDAYKRSGDVTLTEDGNEIIKVNNPNLKIIALTNPPGGEFGDRRPLDSAQIRRWTYHKLPDELPKSTFLVSGMSLFGLGPKIIDISEEEKYTPINKNELSVKQLSEIPGMQEVFEQYAAFHETAKGLLKNKTLAKNQKQKFTYDDREEPRRVRNYIARFYRGDINTTMQEALRYFYAGKVLDIQDKAKLEELIRKIEYIPKVNPDRVGLGIAGAMEGKSKSGTPDGKIAPPTVDATKLEMLSSNIQLDVNINPFQVFTERGVKDRGAGLYSGINFNSWIRPNVKDKLETLSTSLSSFKLKENMTTEQIFNASDAKPFSIDEVKSVLAQMVNNQSLMTNGKNVPNAAEPLLTNGYGNIFLVEDLIDGKSQRFAVDARWRSDDREWLVGAHGLSAGWSAGVRVFWRNEPATPDGKITPEILDRVKASGYLDTSFDGKGVHTFRMEALSKEEALEKYKNSGGKTWIWDDLKNKMPYTTPEVIDKDVIILNFKKNISSEDAIQEMDKLGLRPMTYEELIQFASNNPEYQKQNILVALGSKHDFGGGLQVPVVNWGVEDRDLSAGAWDDWSNDYRFPSVRKDGVGDGVTKKVESAHKKEFLASIRKAMKELGGRVSGPKELSEELSGKYGETIDLNGIELPILSDDNIKTAKDRGAALRLTIVGVDENMFLEKYKRGELSTDNFVWIWEK